MCMGHEMIEKCKNLDEIIEHMSHASCQMSEFIRVTCEVMHNQEKMPKSAKLEICKSFLQMSDGQMGSFYRENLQRVVDAEDSV